jgi:hypothetical protein
MQIVYAACTEGWPEGEAHLVVKELMKRYSPLDTTLKVEMPLQLSKLKMRKGMDPSILFNTIVSLQNQYLGPGKRLPTDELISIVLCAATDEYRPILTIKRKLHGEDLNLEHLEAAMMEEY